MLQSQPVPPRITTFLSLFQATQLARGSVQRFSPQSLRRAQITDMGFLQDQESREHIGFSVSENHNFPTTRTIKPEALKKE